MVSNSNICAVEGCRNTSIPRGGGTYFILPDNKERAEIWKKTLKLNKQTSSGEEIFVCTVHFDGSNFILDTGAVVAPNTVSFQHSSEIGVNNHIDSDVSSDQEVEIQDEEEVFLPFTSMPHLLSSEESTAVLNSSLSFVNTDPLQVQGDLQINHLDSQADEHKERCRVCLQPGAVSTLPAALRETYWGLCSADDLSSMPEPTLCLVCRRLLYNAHKFKELCRAAHAFLAQIFDEDQLEKFSKNLHKLFHHPNLTIAHNVVENCNYFNKNDVSNNYDDGPELHEHSSKIIIVSPKAHIDVLHRNEPEVHSDGSEVHRSGPKEYRNLPILHRDGPPLHRDARKVRINGSKVHRDGPKEQRDGPNVKRGVQILNKIGPKVTKDSNEEKELLVEIQPSCYHINIHNSSSDTDCNDDETSGKADLETKNNNLNALIALAERKKTIAPQTSTRTNKRRRRTRRKKIKEPKIIEILENKKLTFPKTKAYPMVISQKMFDEYIKTTRLSFEDQKRNIEEKKMSVAYKEARYKCDICYKIFISQETLNRHMECHSDKIGDYACAVCHLRFSTVKKLTIHKRRHTYLFTCKLCSFAHSKQKNFMNKFLQRRRAVEHVLHTHRGKRYTCELCNSTYIGKTSYHTHVRIHHPSSNACQLCGYSFLNEYGVACHKLKMHRFDQHTIPEDGPVCSKCNTKFVDKGALEIHLQVSYCSNNTGLNCHFRKLNFGERQHRTVTCEKCNSRLGNFTRYELHFKEKHPNETMAQTRSSRRQRLCHLCGKLFNSLAGLSIHLSTHALSGNFKCDKCGRSFKSKHSLDVHKLIHGGVMFACKVCNREFSHSSNRDRHYKYTHTEVEIVKCGFCDKEFKSVSQKNIHVRHVHLNVPYKKRRRRATAKQKLHKRKEDRRSGEEI